MNFKIRNMFLGRGAFHLAVALRALSLPVFLVGCSDSGSSGSSADPTAAAAAAVDAWNAPVGNPVLGATLSDGWRDLREVPYPITVNGGWTDSVAIMPSGTVMYFAYSRTDFGQFNDSGGTIRNPTGPARPGMTGDAFKTFRAELRQAGWTVTYSPINGDPAVDEASASPNEVEDILAFNRFSAGGVGQLFSSLRTPSGAWASPTVLPTSPPINTPNTACQNGNPFVIGTIASGLTLYFESNRADLAGTSCRSDGKNRLYYATYTSAGGFSQVQPVPGLDAGQPNEDDTQISLSTDKKKVYFTRATSTAYGVFTADLSGNTYTNVRQIVAPNFASPFTGKLSLVGEANVAELPQGSLMYMICGIATSESGGHPTQIQMRVCRAKKPK